MSDAVSRRHTSGTSYKRTKLMREKAHAARAMELVWNRRNNVAAEGVRDRVQSLLDLIGEESYEEDLDESEDLDEASLWVEHMISEAEELDEVLKLMRSAYAKVKAKRAEAKARKAKAAQQQKTAERTAGLRQSGVRIVKGAKVVQGQPAADPASGAHRTPYAGRSHVRTKPVKPGRKVPKIGTGRY
jgi:hypothetical protein